ncbi:hypothetical protein Tco_1548347 [Tanacetum coccineum]
MYSSYSSYTLIWTSTSTQLIRCTDHAMESIALWSWVAKSLAFISSSEAIQTGQTKMNYAQHPLIANALLHQPSIFFIDLAFLDALPEELRDEVNVLADMELSGIGVNMDGCMQSRYVLGKKLSALEREEGGIQHGLSNHGCLNLDDLTVDLPFKVVVMQSVLELEADARQGIQQDESKVRKSG